MAISDAEIRTIRADTPGCANVVHFNNAGSSLMPSVVVDAVVDHMREEARIGGYEAEANADREIQGVYASVARLLGARSAEEIAAVENATRAWDAIFYALPFRRGDAIVTSETEYGSNVISFRQLVRRSGVRVEVVPNDREGLMDPHALRDKLSGLGAAARLVAVSHVPTGNGVVHPVSAIGEVCREFDTPFLLDACQSIGQLDLDLNSVHCDALCGTSRKYLRGPRGQGFLYVKKGGHFWDLEPSFLDVQAAVVDDTAESGYRVKPGAIRFENFERSYANWLGLGRAAEYATSIGLERIEGRVVALADLLRRRLEVEVANARVQDVASRRCGIVTFTLEGHDHEAAVRELRKDGVHISISRARSTPLYLEKRGVSSVLRASVHYYNTEDEISAFLAALKNLPGVL